MTQWRISRDAGAEERRGPGQIELVGNSQDEILVDDDALRVAAVSDAAGMFVLAVVSEDRPVVAKLLEMIPAIVAGPAGIDHATDRSQLAFAEFFHVAPDFDDASDDFVAGHARIPGPAPLAARRMQIGMANAAKKDVDLDVARAGIAAIEREGRE